MIAMLGCQPEIPALEAHCPGDLRVAVDDLTGTGGGRNAIEIG